MTWFRRDPVELHFQRREGILVPQTPDLWALHADVFFSVVAGKPTQLVEAFLVWEVGGRRTSVLRCSWSRAVIDGRFRYPAEALSVPLGPEPSELTLTFDADLIRHPEGPPPADSRLVLHLGLAGSRNDVARPLWQVTVERWDRPARLDWLPGV